MKKIKILLTIFFIFSGQSNLFAMDVNKELLENAEWGDKEQIKTLLFLGANINHQDKEGQTAIIKAARHADKETFSLLLEQGGVEVNHQDKLGNTALIYATLRNSKDLVKLILEKLADPNLKNKLGNTALTYAAMNNYVYIARELINNGAQVDHQNKKGNTPLTIAARRDHKNIVFLFIEKRANIDHQNNKGNTALMLAAGRGYKDIVIFLLDNGANIELKNKKNKTATDFAIKSGLIKENDELTMNNISFKPIPHAPITSDVEESITKRGIINPGSRCYLVSLLQCLSAFNFPADLLEDQGDNPYAGFLNELKRSVPEPLNIPVEILKKASDFYSEEEFAPGGEQQDPTEFLLHLLNLVDTPMFSIKLESKLLNLSTNESRSNPVSEFMFVLPVTKEDQSSQSLLNDYLNKEEIIDEFRWNDEDEETISIKKSLVFKEEPDILILNLNRFEFNPETGQIKKIKTNVKIDEKINLGDSSYTLSGIILHGGEKRDSGHYISIVNKDSNYYICDDSTVRGPYHSLSVPLAKMRNSNPYVMFYKKNQ